MSYPDSNNPLADRKFILFIIISVAILFGWQKYLSVKYPSVGQADNHVTQKPPDPVNGANVPRVAEAPAPTATNVEQKVTETLRPETLLNYQDDKVHFTVTTRGMGLNEFVLHNYKDNNGKNIRMGLSPAGPLFAVGLVATGKLIDFDIKELGRGSYEGTAVTPVGKITRLLKYDPVKRAFESSVTIDNPTTELSRGLTLLLPDTIREAPATTFLMPSYHNQDFYVEHGGTNDMVNVSRAKTDVNKSFENATIVSSGDQYFTMAVVDRSEITPDVNLKADLKEKTATAQIVYKPVQVQKEMSFRETLYAGPKSIDILQNIDPAMASLINFGWFGIIGKPMLWIMKWFYTIVGNWGVAIILLTLMVRLVVLPFTLMSSKSMKAMQQIQPLLKAVKERYKDDPAAQQRETMALMKAHNANPIGGCLPMVLQIPIFFALYRVISVSVELYQAPFAGWIHDLSAADPYYILPGIMAIGMFVQTKMTPTAADPTQAKMMQFMPVLMAGLMLKVPTGLTIYMIVSSLFGIGQQYFILRNTKQASVPAKK